MKLKRLALLAGLVVTSMSAQADFFGTLSGRSADPSNSPAFSVEGSFSNSSSYRSIGARVNYDVNEVLTVYGDFGISEYGIFGFGGRDGTSFGAGVFYYLPGITPSGGALSRLDAAIQGSFHLADLDGTDFTGFGVALLISPKEAINARGLSWYANAGLSRLAFDTPGESVSFGFGFGTITSGSSTSDIEPQIGGGIHLPLGPGTLYAGADIIDEFIAGVGYRFGF